MYAIDIGILNFYQKKCCQRFAITQTLKYGNVAPEQIKHVFSRERKREKKAKVTGTTLR